MPLDLPAVDEALVARDGRAVRLRTLAAADGAAFAAHVAADLERLSKHLAWPARTTEADAAAAWIDAYARQEGGRLALAGLWHGDALLGGVCLLAHDAVNANAELGCWVVAGAEGQGLVAAGCRRLAGVAAAAGIRRLDWHAAPTNVRSRALAERLGFVYEGTLRSNYALGDGRRLDTDVLSLVGDELPRAAAAG